MHEDKPKNISEYKRWLKKKHSTNITGKTRNYYESATNKIYSDFKDSAFWMSLTENLNHMSQKYTLTTGYPLFANDQAPKLFIKKFDPFFLKSFRQNVKNNKNWPLEPDGGWVLPNHWFFQINDIVRTFFVVKYLDGVQFLIDQIKSLAEEHDMKCTVDFEAKEEGYYAAHTYIVFNCSIPKVDWDTTPIKVFIELQITTQLQEVIRKLLHQYYEDRRKKHSKDELKWQWNYKSNEFAANYLGHILHYIEGMIMEVRSKQKEKK